MSTAAVPTIRVLIVEDEYFIATDLAHVLTEAGFAVVGQVRDGVQARRLLDDGAIDVAIINLDVDGRPVFGLAEELAARDIPYVFVTGYDAQVVPATLAAAPLLTKPCDGDRIGALLRRIARGNRTA